jgi:hypothetical protein
LYTARFVQIHLFLKQTAYGRFFRNCNQVYQHLLSVSYP